MEEQVQFETPENVQVSYRVAGLGTRFMAWVYDITLIVLIILGLWLLVLLLTVLNPGWLAGLYDAFPLFFVVVLVLIHTLGPVLYFLISEHAMNGQTWGKRKAGIRAVSEKGFSLTFSALALRNIFRVIDTLPPLWTVPFLSGRGQRFGDMVAGTIVVSDEAPQTQALHAALLTSSEARFSFTPGQLQRLAETDIQAVERYLDRRATLEPDAARQLAERLVAAVTARMEYAAAPGTSDAQVFLENLMAAHLRREMRELT